MGDIQLLAAIIDKFSCVPAPPVPLPLPVLHLPPPLPGAGTCCPLAGARHHHTRVTLETMSH